MQRRQFLALGAKVLGAALVLSTTALGLPFVFPPKGARKHRLRYSDLLREEELPRRGVKRAELSYQWMGTRQKMKLYVVRARGRLLVLSPRCSHLGCFVNYNPLKEEFHCPCHGGRYDITGRVLAGPPPEPLSRLPWRIAHGWLQVGIREVA